MIDVYTSFEWLTLCEAVQCLQVDLGRGKVIQLARAVNESRDTFRDTGTSPRQKPSDYRRDIVEAVGIEPSSEHRVSHDSIAITRKGLDAEAPP